jgi:hypothetical protein
MRGKTRCSVILAIIAAALSGGCVAATDDELDRFDGTYDYSVTVTGSVYQVSQSFYVTNGEISNSEGNFSGSVLDDFGNVEFTGPCPSGSTGGAVYTGILNEGNPKFGQGSWSCSGSPGSTWRVYNGN